MHITCLDYNRNKISKEHSNVIIFHNNNNHPIYFLFANQFMLIRLIPQGTVDNNLEPDHSAGPKTLDPNYEYPTPSRYAMCYDTDAGSIYVSLNVISFSKMKFSTIWDVRPSVTLFVNLVMLEFTYRFQNY